MSDGSTPPEISNGSFVSWNGGKGRVDLVVSNGKVPGVDDDVEGTAKSPAARVVVWENDKPTRKKIGVSTHTLKRIPPIKGNEKKAGSAALVEILADHEEAMEALPAHSAMSAKSIKTAYDRGLASHPGEEVTALTAEEWATGRVRHLVKVAAAATDDPILANPGNDTDLLDPAHPLYVAEGDLTHEGEEPLFAEGEEPSIVPDATAAAESDPEDTDPDVETSREGDRPEGSPEDEGKQFTLDRDEIKRTMARFTDLAD